jgi:phage terminase large subunit
LNYGGQALKIVIPYSPHDGQKPFHQARYKTRFRLISAGTGAGKTFAGVFETLSWLLENQGCTCAIFEPTYRKVREVLIPTLERLLGSPLISNPLVKSYNQTDKHIELVKGSHLWFGSLEYPESAEGENLDFVHVDEARLVPHFDQAWMSIQRRLRGSIPNRFPTGAIVTTTPDMPGSAIHKFFEDPKTKNPDAEVYRFSIDANAANLPAGYVENMKRIHTGSYAERFIYGRFAAVGMGCFPFDVTVHVPDVLPTQFSFMRYGLDFGWTNPSALIAVGFDSDGRAYALDEFYETQTTIPSLVNEYKRMKELYGNGPLFCDPTELQTIQTIRSSGIDARKYEFKRADGIRELGSRFKVAGDGKPRLFIGRSCVNLISELMEYKEEVKENDHAIDSIRYAIPVTPEHRDFAYVIG